MASVFFSYSHKDEELRDRLETHLAMLKHQNVIETWHDRRIQAGCDFSGKIGDEIEKAEVILLLVSSDFLASDYCYDVETRRALERHDAGEARVIPIILRPCDWHAAPFGELLAAPRDAKPVTTWANLDEAFLDIVKAIRSALQAEEPIVKQRRAPNKAIQVRTGPRSSNLRLRKEFTDADRDRFLEEAFEFMAAFFQNSLSELKARNEEIDFSFRRVDANRFTSTLYKAGKAISTCRISLGGSLGKGIFFLAGEDHGQNAFNESLSVEADDQGLFLRPLGMGRPARESHLTFEGGAELYWSSFMQGLQ